jgi:hypothetical protein
MTDNERCAAVCADVPGYSDAKHYAFFRHMLSQNIQSMLMLGVYCGRDLAMCCDIAKDFPDRRFMFLGVDKFSDTPCDDWPEDARDKTWEQAGYGTAPCLSRAKENIERHRPENTAVALIPKDDLEFLASCPISFDCVYLDTSHDYGHVRRQLSLVKNACHIKTLICGDDYSDAGTWGVKRAVIEAFYSHGVFAEWLWHANYVQLKK